jgi:hypothetical protein
MDETSHTHGNRRVYRVRRHETSSGGGGKEARKQGRSHACSLHGHAINFV